MPITSNDWNVVVVGHWNRAILTPSGIARRILNLPEETPVQVEVALDAYLPYRVRHENVIITPFRDRFHVQPVSNTFEAVSRALNVANSALDWLPQTPVVAAGFNLNYKATETYPSLRDATKHVLDDRLSQNEFKIDSRSIIRALPWKDGHIKLSVTEESDASFSVFLNFDRRSTDVSELKKWLNTPIKEIEEAANKILFDCLDLDAEDIHYGE